MSQNNKQQKLEQVMELERLESLGVAQKTTHNGNEAYLVTRQGKTLIYSLEIKGFPTIARFKGELR